MTVILQQSPVDEEQVCHLSTPKGKKQWVYRYAPEGPVLESGCPPPPQWVVQAAKAWWIAIERINSATSCDVARTMREHLDHALPCLQQALLYEIPGTANRMTKLALSLERETRQPHCTPELAEVCLTNAKRIREALRRYAPAKKVLEEGPTHETQGKLQQDNLRLLFASGDLTQMEMQAANAVVSMHNDLTGRIGYQTANLEKDGGGHGASYRQPIAALHDDDLDYFLHDYRPWSTLMSRVAWWCSPYSSDRKTGLPTYLTVILGILIDGRSPEESDKYHRLPTGRSLKVLKLGLNCYAPHELRKLGALG